jgi:anti-sigma factor RsiW
MKCGAARKHLYLLREPTSEEISYPIQAEAAQAESHLENCHACQEFFAAEERLRTFLKTRVPKEKASSSLREGLLAQITQERERAKMASRRFNLFGRRNAIFVWVGILLVAAVFVAYWFNERRPRVDSQRIASTLVEDHAHSFSDRAEITSSDHNLVQSYFEGKLAFSFHLPPTSDPSLIGGRLCYLRGALEGRTAALIFYQHPQSRVSLFVFDGSNIELPEERLIALDGKRCLLDAKMGYNTVLWKERGLLYGLVSDARSADLLQMAAQF